jgi:hypothetical protein
MAGHRRAKRDGYTPDLGKRICDLVAEGRGLGSIEAMDGMPPRRTVRAWLEKHPEFRESYEAARRWRADHLVDEALEIVDGVRGSDSSAAVQAARNAADMRRWLASKLLPERFGDKLEVSSDPDRPLLPPAEQLDPSRIALAVLNVLGADGRHKRSVPPTIDAERVAEAEAQPEPERTERTYLAETYAAALSDPAPDGGLAASRRAWQLYGSAPPVPPSAARPDLATLRREFLERGMHKHMSLRELGLDDPPVQLKAIRGGRS